MEISVRQGYAACLAMLLGASTLGGQPAQAADGFPVIAVLVYNYAQVPDQELAQAKAETQRILLECGIRLNWRDYVFSESVAEPDAPSRRRMSNSLSVALRILPRAMAERLRLDPLAFGFAVAEPEGEFLGAASVFYHKSRELADFRKSRGGVTLGQKLAQRMPPVAMILGHLMAHEMGHLLLGRDSHSRRGIMAVPWGRLSLAFAASGKLLFTREQARRIQARVHERSGVR